MSKTVLLSISRDIGPQLTMDWAQNEIKLRQAHDRLKTTAFSQVSPCLTAFMANAPTTSIAETFAMALSGCASKSLNHRRVERRM